MAKKKVREGGGGVLSSRTNERILLQTNLEFYLLMLRESAELPICDLIDPLRLPLTV